MPVLHSSEYQATDGLIVPGVYNMGNSLNPVSATNSMNEKAIESVYGSVNLDLFDGVYLTLTGRNDWSSTLPEETRSYFYPAVSGSVVLSEFIKMPKVIDFWKIRGSWTTTKHDMDVYAINDVYSMQMSSLLRYAAIYNSSKHPVIFTCLI